MDTEKNVSSPQKGTISVQWVKMKDGETNKGLKWTGCISSGKRGWLCAWGVLCHDKRVLTLIFALLLQIFKNVVWLPEALFEKVDQGLTEVLPCCLVVEEVTFVWIDLDNHRARITLSTPHLVNILT